MDHNVFDNYNTHFNLYIFYDKYTTFRKSTVIHDPAATIVARFR